MGIFRRKQQIEQELSDAAVVSREWGIAEGDMDAVDDAHFARAIAEGRANDPEPYPSAIGDLKIA